MQVRTFFRPNLYVFEILRFHSCPNCKVPSVRETTNSDKEKRKLLSKYGEVTYIYGCEWDRKRLSVMGTGAWKNGPSSPYSIFYYKSQITENDILEAVLSDQFLGN